MKLLSLSLIAFLSYSLAFAGVGTADRSSYIITLNATLTDAALDICMEKICVLSGSKANVECAIVAKRFRIVAASLSNSAVSKVKALKCVKSLRAEQFDFEAQPRSGTSN